MLVTAARARDTGGMENEGQSETVAAPKLKRRWLQFSTRALLVAVTVLGVTLGVIGWRAEPQRQAVAAIEALGGLVLYRGDERSSSIEGFLRPFVPRDYYDNVWYVDFQSEPITDEHLALLEPLTGTTHLYLARANVTDAGLAALKPLTLLEELQLDETPVTDDGLVHLRGLTRMRWLSLNDTRVTDAGLTHLRAMHDIHWLNVEGTHVTNAGGVHLQEFLQFCGVFNGDEWPDAGRP
jgi:hypothetical protein